MCSPVALLMAINERNLVIWHIWHNVCVTIHGCRPDRCPDLHYLFQTAIGEVCEQWDLCDRGYIEALLNPGISGIVPDYKDVGSSHYASPKFKGLRISQTVKKGKSCPNVGPVTLVCRLGVSPLLTSVRPKI